MGKIFPLSEKASCFEATLQLIEKSFHYQRPNSFEIDFAPLIDKSNHHNCFILIDENEKVVAHIGTKDKFILLEKSRFPVTRLGGIAVDETRRGEGHFQTLLQDVLAEKRSDTSLFLLWSDLEKLYNKFGFYLCGAQFEVDKGKETSQSFITTTFASLRSEEKQEVKNLYQSSFQKEYLSLSREETDWKLIEKISSADLYIKKSGDNLAGYFFMNKGQDLPGIIYEYGTQGSLEDFLREISPYGKVWTGKEIIPTKHVQFQFFLSPGDIRLFSEFVSEFTKGKISIRTINVMKQEVFFDYNEELHALETQDFLRGIFGPGTFEELDLSNIYLSGLDSI